MSVQKFRWTLLLLIAFSLLTIPAVAQDGDLVGIRFMTDETDPVSIEADNYIVETFQEAYPTVRMIPEYVTSGNMYEKAILLASTGMAPDLLYGTLGQAIDFQALGLIEPLDDVAAQIGDLDPQLVEQYTIDGNLYSIPAQTGSFLYYYRSDLAEQAGITEPPTDWMEWLALLAALDGVAPEGTAAFTHISGGSRNAQIIFFQHLWNNGGFVFNPDGTSAFDTTYRVESIEVLNFMKELSQYAPEGFLGKGDIEAGLDYINGSAASILFSTRLFSQIYAANPDLLDDTVAIIPPPAPGHDPILFAGPNVWMVFKQDDPRRVQAAKDYIVHFMTGDRYARFLNAVPMHLLPTRTNFLTETPEYLDNPITSHFQSTLTQIIGGLGTSRYVFNEYGPPIATAGAAWGSSAMVNNVEQFLAGNITAEEAIDNIAAEFNALATGS